MLYVGSDAINIAANNSVVPTPDPLTLKTDAASNARRAIPIQGYKTEGFSPSVDGLFVRYTGWCATGPNQRDKDQLA